MYPAGAPQYSLQRLLGDVPADVDTLVFPNHESLPERSDIASPFEEVSPPPSPTPTPSASHRPTKGLIRHPWLL